MHNIAQSGTCGVGNVYLAKTIGNYSITLEVKGESLFAVDVREWPYLMRV
ncbi:Uncharacterised protein [uncultured archaeon]|nr:Uncharacterised protein [uncultured archaeon]